jgi:RimJ/RimL family protein N-acetyltransferase
MSVAVLETNRLTLRPLAEADAEPLHAAYGDINAMQFWNRCPTKSVVETAKRIRESIAADENEHAA